MTLSIADDFRAEFAKIMRRYPGYVPDAIAAIRVSTVEKLDAFVADTSERLAACTCHPVPAFEINTDRTDARPYAIMEEVAIQRMIDRGMG